MGAVQVPATHLKVETPMSVFGLGTDELYGATRWRF
jgi:hypothetical protein